MDLIQTGFLQKNLKIVMHDIKHYSIDGSEKTSFQSEHISISIGIDRF